MRGRVAVLSLLLSLPFSLFADCSWVPRYSGQFRTTALDVAVDGNFVWIATGYGVQLLADGAIVDSIALPGSTRVIRPGANSLAYAGSGARVYVLRREGNRLRLLRSVPTSGTVNDIALSSYLFVATTSGIDHFDLADPTSPFKTNAFLSTSSPNVSSLAVGRNVLYAADRDATVEMFSITIPSLPQNIGVLETVPIAVAVHVADNLLYVANAVGPLTDVFNGTSRVARLDIQSNSFGAGTGGAHFVAGADRTLRAVDVSSLTRVAELFEYQFAPTDGTDNVIHAIARLGDEVYVAAGDIGLVVLDATRIAKPYPFVSYGGGATTAVHVSGTSAWFSDATGKLIEQRIDASGLSLVEQRSWTGGAGATVRDQRDNGLLTSSGATLTLWSLLAATPIAATSFTFPDAVVDAVLADAYAVALLANGSVYTATSLQAAPQKVNVPAMTFLSRVGSAMALTEVREGDGKTVVHYYANGDLATEPRRFTLDGAATGTVALDATRAAVFTFNGINVIDLATGNVRTIAESNRIIPNQLAFAGDDLLAVDSRHLAVFDDARTLVREQLLAADTIALAATTNVAVLATAEGTAASLYLAELPRPELPFSNAFYTDMTAAGDRLYAIDKGGIDIFSTLHDAPSFVAGIPAAGAIDFAASEDGLYVLAANGVITRYSPMGVTLVQAVIDEGVDSQPLAIHAVGNAAWVSFSTGCTTGGCQRKTYVLDPNTLAVTSALTGSIRDVALTGTRAYALFDLPSEVRVIDIADPLHPAPVVAIARPASIAATSIAHEPGKVHVLGDRLYTYSDATLTPIGEQFTSMTVDPAQQIRIKNGCAIVTGRAESPQLFSLPSFTPAAAQFSVPSNVRTVALSDGRVVLLTGHSFEIWSSDAPRKPGRRRAVR